MKDISQNTLDEIKKQRIQPRPRRYFLVKRATIWALVILSIGLGSLAGAVLIFQLENAEWELYRHIGHSVFEFLLLVLPYFWILITGCLTAVSLYYFRRTSGGYRYRTASVVLISLVLSLIGASLFHLGGISERLEAVFENTLPFYEGVEGHKRKMWMTPEKGLLAGKISSVLNDHQIILTDLRGKDWQVDVEKAVWRGRMSPVKDLEIKLIGRMTGEDKFIADEIRSWHGRGKNKHHRDHTN